MTIDDLLADAVALSFRQSLEPVEGPSLPVFPPTYPAPKGGEHRNGTPYTVNQLKDGTWTACLDSVQSQANRMESIFHGQFRDTVPQISVQAGERSVPLTELSHRLADAVVRCTALHDDIRGAFESYAAGNPVPVARLCPTALVYGAWDSRDTQVKIPRIIRSEIYAHDVDVFTRSAQFSATFTREELEMNEKEWEKGAKVGFAPTPSVDQHGGVIVHGDIAQFAAIHLGPMRALVDETQEGVLGRYVLGLALVGLLYGGRDYALRTGCWLVPNGAPEATVVRRDGSRQTIELHQEEAATFLREAAKEAEGRLQIPVSGQARVFDFDPKRGKAELKRTGFEGA